MIPVYIFVQFWSGLMLLALPIRTYVLPSTPKLPTASPIFEYEFMNYGETIVHFSPVHFWKDATGGGHKRESVVYGIHFPISRS